VAAEAAPWSGPPVVEPASARACASSATIARPSPSAARATSSSAARPQAEPAEALAQRVLKGRRGGEPLPRREGHRLLVDVEHMLERRRSDDPPAGRRVHDLYQPPVAPPGDDEVPLGTRTTAIAGIAVAYVSAT
jgi:hypothetical protein